MAAHETGTCSVYTREDLRELKDGTVGRRNSYAPNTGVASCCSGCGKPPLERLRAEQEASASRES